MDLVWFAILGVFAALSAVALIVWGRRGWRVDRHPLCRKCGYDLFGLTEHPDGVPKACAEAFLKCAKECRAAAGQFRRL